jgi:hypothetical protein
MTKNLVAIISPQTDAERVSETKRSIEAACLPYPWRQPSSSGEIPQHTLLQQV